MEKKCIAKIKMGRKILIGSKEYNTTTTIAGAVPIPKKGIINPKSAILGIACVTLVIPNTGLFNFCLQLIKIPMGTPIMIAINRAKDVSSICSIQREMI